MLSTETQSIGMPSSTDVSRTSKPLAWTLVDFRDDPHGQPDPQPLTSTTPTDTNGSSVPVMPSKPPSMSSLQDFEFLKDLGSGSWSTVMEATHNGTGKRYAIKILSKAQLIKQKKAKYANVEKDALIKLSGSHPGIVRMYAAFQDEISLYFVLDLAPHGDLASLVKKYGSLSLRCARWYTAQIVDAVFWMHSKGILHRDMKPENVLLDNELRVKLTDFGSAYLAPNGDLSPRSSTFVGSAAYVSPELLNRASKTTSNSSDIWAIGCTLFFIIAGVPPFAAINDYQSFRKIEALNYTFPDEFYDVAKGLIQRLLVLDPADRLGVEPKSSPTQLREHRFFIGPQSLPEDTAPIRWETLWTDPPVPPETGIVPPAPPDIFDEVEEDDPWGDVVREFSLVQIRPPNSGLLSPDELLLPSSRSKDVPPDVIPSEVVETISDEPPSPNGDTNDMKDEDVGDPALKAKDWSNVVAGESVRYAASARTLLRRGLLKQPRQCALLLTSRPAVLCVALDDKVKALKYSDVRHSFIFPTSTKKEKGEAITACKLDIQQKRLTLQTVDKEYVYDFADDTTLARFADKIKSIIES